MTVFTKTNEDAKEIPKVVVSSPLTTPTAPPNKEQDISNSGWVPMEGGRFDRPKKERSSSFGPLSIIRLSPSPLARTPTPTLPDQGNAEKKTRFAYKEGVDHGRIAAKYQSVDLQRSVDDTGMKSEKNATVEQRVLLGVRLEGGQWLSTEISGERVVFGL
ncbi:hypothetical protein RB195_004347 [Necator americanus]|uniref:Uncharacterized protein n=1 Tax=Necator americanus TaxID=51031 RepID=A0ABR1BHI8_NECAM